MVKQRRRELALGAVLAVLVMAWWLLRGPSGTSAPGSPAAAARPAAAGRAGPAAAELPRIDLDRLRRPRAGVAAGARNIFAFAPDPAPPAPPPPPPAAVAAGPGGGEPAAARVAAGPPQPPPLSVKLIGALESKPGLKVAILMTDRKEILTGQAGETVANRLKIVAIGHESVDVQDVGSERVRRIPLKGN